MEQVTTYAYDLREYKKIMRGVCMRERKAMDPYLKHDLDEDIRERLEMDREYKDAKTVLAYVSSEIEVDTHEIIEDAIEDGKRVACPRCIPGTHEMEFYYIDSLDDLVKGSYGIYEPDIEKCELASDVDGALCLVPGLCFDRRGYRLGYGGGYYDRYLGAHQLVTVGLCYSFFVVRELLHGRYDARMDKVITNFRYEAGEGSV
ncbi:MAG: 5-formyltetrahydrofolate cyclo-ligase [Oscillospiraceae bacterium]|nr:5-formyltetrahydrofolate cyclo-ligase [Oscillospiraceae bacterium]